MKPYNQKPLSLAARVMCFVGASVGLSLLLIGNLVLNVVERHFAEQDAEEVAVINKAVIYVLRNNNDNNLQLSKILIETDKNDLKHSEPTETPVRDGDEKSLSYF